MYYLEVRSSIRALLLPEEWMTPQYPYIHQQCAASTGRIDDPLTPVCKNPPLPVHVKIYTCIYVV